MNNLPPLSPVICDEKIHTRVKRQRGRRRSHSTPSPRKYSLNDLMEMTEESSSHHSLAADIFIESSNHKAVLMRRSSLPSIIPAVYQKEQRMRRNSICIA
jgi:hypothetical protein